MIKIGVFGIHKNLFKIDLIPWDSIRLVGSNEIIHKTDNIKYLHLKSSTFYRYGKG